MPLFLSTVLTYCLLSEVPPQRFVLWEEHLFLENEVDVIAVSCTTSKLLILHEKLARIYDKVSAAMPTDFNLRKVLMTAALPCK